MPTRKLAVKTVGNKKPLVKSAGGVGGGNKKKGGTNSKKSTNHQSIKTVDRAEKLKYTSKGQVYKKGKK